MKRDLDEFCNLSDDQLNYLTKLLNMSEGLKVVPEFSQSIEFIINQELYVILGEIKSAKKKEKAQK